MLPGSLSYFMLIVSDVYSVAHAIPKTFGLQLCEAASKGCKWSVPLWWLEVKRVATYARTLRASDLGLSQAACYSKNISRR